MSRGCISEYVTHDRGVKILLTSHGQTVSNLLIEVIAKVSVFPLFFQNESEG